MGQPRVRYAIPQQSPVRLTVFDLQGREVTVLVDEVKMAGWHEVSFNGQHLSSGTYFYQLRSGSTVLSHTLMLLK